jgi:hypothetical protein
MKKILYISSAIPALNSNNLNMHDYTVIKHLANKYEIYLLIVKTGNLTQRNKDFKNLIFLKKKLKLKKIFLEFKVNKITYLDKLFFSRKLISPFLDVGKKYNSICKKLNIPNCYVSCGKNGLEAAFEIKDVKKICNVEHPDFVNYEIKKRFKNFFKPEKQIINLNRNIILRFFANIWSIVFIKKLKIKDYKILKNLDVILCHNSGNRDFFRNFNLKSYYVPTFSIIKKRILKKSKNRVFTIVANLSNQSSTSNFLSIHYICHKFLPELKRHYNGKDIKIILLGNKESHFDKKTEKILNDEIFINKGWVDDADHELQKSDLFFICANAYLKDQNTIVNNFKINLSITQSRIANIWSNKVCLIAHSENKRCSDVLKHLDNCILAKNPKDLAKWVIKLKKNCRLKDKIANNGYKTFKDKCQSKNFSKLLEKHIIENFL